MDIYKILHEDHITMKKLLAELVAAGDLDTEKRSVIIEKVRDELVPHARAEEAVFYNPLRTIEGMHDVVFHGYGEHIEAEVLLRALQTQEATGIPWTATAEKLKEAVTHHMDEEEEKIFASAKLVLTKEEADLMGEAFEQMKEQVKEGSLLQNSLELAANLLPGRFAEQARNLVYPKS